MSLSPLVALAMMGAWCLVIGEFSPGQALLGLIFGTLFVLVTGAGAGQRIPLAQLPHRLAYLGIYLLVLIPYSVIRSNLDMARRLLRPKPDIRPGIVRVRLGSAPEPVSALMAHAITMSPGEMVVDYSEDGRTLYVHLVDVTETEAKRASWRIYRRVFQRIFT